MRRFRFRLQGVLAWRRRQVHFARERLAAALAALRLAEGQLAEARARRAAWAARLAGREREGLAAADLQQGRSYLERLQREERSADDRREAALQAEQACRQDLVEARRGERVLELLRERQLSAYRHEALRREQRLLDDMRPGGSPCGG